MMNKNFEMNEDMMKQVNGGITHNYMTGTVTFTCNRCGNRLKEHRSMVQRDWERLGVFLGGIKVDTAYCHSCTEEIINGTVNK